MAHRRRVEHGPTFAYYKAAMDRDSEKSKAQLLNEVRELRAEVLRLRTRPRTSEFEALRESERRLRTAQAIGAVGDWEFCVESQEIFWSEQVYKLFERDPSLGPPTYEENNAYYLPKDSARLQENVRKAIEHGEPSDEDYRLKLPSGKLVEHRGVIGVKTDSTGATTHLRGTVQDITERKHREAERALQAQVMLHMPEAVYLVRLSDGVIVHANSKFEEMFGYREGEMVGRHASVVNAPDDIPPEVKAAQILRVLAETGTWEGEIENIKKDGTRFWCFATVSTFEHPTLGEVLIAVHTDITARRQAMEALRESEARLRAIMDHSPALVSTKGLDGKVLLANRRFELLAEDPQNTIVGHGVFDLFPKDVAEALWENDLLAREGAIEAEELVQHLDGSEHTYLTAKFPITDSQGTLVGTGAISTDITERKLAEERSRKLKLQLQEAEKLESLGVLAGGIAHDFNNLFQVILGNAELLGFHLPKEPKALARLEKITQATCEASDLASQMLAYAGKGPVFRKKLDLGVLLSETSSLLEKATSKKTTLSLNKGSDLPSLSADPRLLQQVLLNLVTNASEAIGDQPGEIKVETRAINCDRDFLDGALGGESLPEGLYVCLEVSDNGCGMDEETQNKACEPFFSTKFTGRGLGLSTVLGVVRTHEGALKVESVVGQGTTLLVLLPAGLPADTSSAPGEWRGGGTILIADDEDMVREVACDFLEHLGFSVLPAADGLEAVRLFREHHEEIACVILDLKMPRLNGDEAYLQLKQIRDSVPTILASGYTEEAALAGLRDEGLAGFIQKPYSLSALRKLLRKVLGS
jgi:PAS domain S-box-containing protein